MSEPRYISLEQRAAWLIEKASLAWQEVQRFAMEADDLVDSVILLGQELWLPHHETDGSRFRVTLRLAIHFPAERRAEAETQVDAFLRRLEESMADERGTLAVAGSQ